MAQELIEPFVEGTLQMMGMMFGLEARVVDSGMGDAASVLFGTIRFQGEPHGLLTLGLSVDDGRQLVAAKLGLEDTDIDDETLRDGLGEMANVIAGFARSALDGDESMRMGLPEIAESAPTGANAVARRVESDLGSFMLMVDLQRAA